jgi:site-specific DNA-methyltransferase (adenine-specific)
MGLENMPLKKGIRVNAPRENEEIKTKHRLNNHPTVKPLKLMEYLCALTKTPTGGIVLDPFMGSGTTGVACVNTGRNFIGIELDETYFKIAQDRISAT